MMWTLDNPWSFGPSPVGEATLDVMTTSSRLSLRAFPRMTRGFAKVQGAVGIRTIDQVDGLSDGVLEGPLGLRLVRLPAEFQSQGQPADLDTGCSEVLVFLMFGPFPPERHRESVPEPKAQSETLR
jgi:hypothetical protein